MLSCKTMIFLQRAASKTIMSPNIIFVPDFFNYSKDFHFFVLNIMSLSLTYFYVKFEFKTTKT